MRIRSMMALLAALALSAAAGQASALTLPVVGGPGMDQGQVCPTGSLCPGTPVLTLIGTAAVSGSFTYNSGPGTVDFSLTLTAPASFGAVSILPGSTFVASGVPVISAPLGGGAFVISQIAPASGSVGLSLAPAFPLLASTPAVSGLTCTIGTGADQCGLSLGPGGLTVDASPLGIFDAFVTFNVNVPEPGTLATLALGIAGLAFASRSRRA